MQWRMLNNQIIRKILFEAAFFMGLLLLIGWFQHGLSLPDRIEVILADPMIFLHPFHLLFLPAYFVALLIRFATVRIVLRIRQ